MTELDEKLVPVAVIGTGPLPASALVGEMEVSAGTVPVTLRLIALDCQPPPSELATEIARAPDCATSPELSWMLSWVLLIKVVVLELPFTSTCESVKKFVPVMVMVCPELPACTLVGEMARTMGILEELWSNGLRTASS